jgi:hypothetical protein
MREKINAYQTLVKRARQKKSLNRFRCGGERKMSKLILKKYDCV